MLSFLSFLRRNMIVHHKRELLALIIILKLPINMAYKKVKHGPKIPSPTDSTTCDEFSKQARFNPYSVTDEYWFTFYFWAPHTKPIILKFLAPTTKELVHLRHHLDRQVEDPIDWNTTVVLMEDVTHAETHILFRRGDQINSPKYWIYIYTSSTDLDEPLQPLDLRIKQTSDNKYLGLMLCEKGVVYALSRKKEVPPQHLLQEAAMKLNYYKRGGKSYLYQGHSWLPIPEINENHYWMTPREKEDPENAGKCLFD